MIKKLESVAEVRDAIRTIKHDAKCFSTTWFADDDTAQRWIDRSLLFSIGCNEAMLILRKDREFHHVHHVSANSNALNAVLRSEELRLWPTVLTADLISNGEDLHELAFHYLSNGFEPYRTLVRMARVSLGQSLPSTKNDVIVGDATHSRAVLGFLESLLDPFAEQIPDLSEMVQACSRGNVLLVQVAGQIGGVLYYESKGLSAVLRYWFVHPECRKLGIGARLIRSMFQRCAASKRIVLWVFEDNADAIAKYEHYGFARERVKDLIVMRKPA